MRPRHRTCAPNATPGECVYSMPKRCGAPATYWIAAGPDYYQPLCERHTSKEFMPPNIEVHKGLPVTPPPDSLEMEDA